jgi:hypothetical protein
MSEYLSACVGNECVFCMTGLTVVEDAMDELQRAVRGGGADDDLKITAAALHVDPHGWLAGTEGLSSGPSLFMVVCRGGTVTLFSLPGLNLVGTYTGAPDGPSVLAPSEEDAGAWASLLRTTTRRKGAG